MVENLIRSEMPIRSNLKTRLWASTFFVLVLACIPATAAPPLFDKLKKSYDEKIVSEMAPLFESFKATLLSAEKFLAIQGRLEDALKVREFRVKFGLEGVDPGWVNSPPVAPPELAAPVKVFIRQYRNRIGRWNNIYQGELAKLGKKYVASQRLEDALVVKDARLALEKMMAPARTPLGGAASAVDLNKFLPGRVFSYKREEGGEKEIHFLKGKVYDPEFKIYLDWMVRKRTVVMSHPKAISDIHLVFSDNGLSYRGTVLKTGAWRRGKFVEKRPHKP